MDNYNIEIENDKIIHHNQEYIKIKCAKCSKIFSKTLLPSDRLITVIEKELYKIKPAYMKCFCPLGGLRVNETQKYLFERVKCISCDGKFGRLVKSASSEHSVLLDFIIFKHNAVKIEKIDSSEIENEYLIKIEEEIERNEKWLKLEDKFIIFDYASKVFERLNIKLEAMNSAMEQSCLQYQEILAKIDELKERLMELKIKYKKSEDKMQIDEKEEERLIQTEKGKEITTTANIENSNNNINLKRKTSPNENPCTAKKKKKNKTLN